MSEKEKAIKEKAIKKEKNKLKKIFKDIDKNKLDFVQTLIDRLAWLNVSVRELEELVDEEGTMIEYNNGGGQSGMKDNPNVKTLINYTKNITTITKQLVDLVPPNTKKSKLMELLDE